MRRTTSKWVGGLAEWTEGDTAYLSVAFTWLLDQAYARALWYRALGYKVRAGGPALFLVRMKHELADVAELGGDIPDALSHHNPAATIFSRGCPVNCWFCIVPKMEGTEFTLIPDAPVRSVLCDNNLSALPADFQRHIISRYQAEGVPLLDANSGFEPRTFDDEVFARWSAINRGPWRFAYDDQAEAQDVERVMRMLREVPTYRKRVYVLIGNEPFEACMERIQRVIDWGGEPHVQPLMKLAALDKQPWVKDSLDWDEQGRQRWITGAQLLRDVARWANGHVWKKAPFSEYVRSQTKATEVYAEQEGLFA